MESVGSMKEPTQVDKLDAWRFLLSDGTLCGKDRDTRESMIRLKMRTNRHGLNFPLFFLIHDYNCN